jgi:hypothetical protein
VPEERRETPPEILGKPSYIARFIIDFWCRSSIVIADGAAGDL